MFRYKGVIEKITQFCYRPRFNNDEVMTIAVALIFIGFAVPLIAVLINLAS